MKYKKIKVKIKIKLRKKDETKNRYLEYIIYFADYLKLYVLINL